MRLAEALAICLRDLGVEYVFGVSGANIEHFHDAIHRHGENRLSSVMAKSEVGAAFMADCHARTHRTLGVCCATSGGGMMNLAFGIAEAHAESVPVLAVVGQPPMQLEGCGGFQDSSGIGRTVNGIQLWESISKYCRKITDGREFWAVLETAIREAMSDRQGPAILLIPRDVYDTEVGPRPDDFPGCLDEARKAPAVPKALTESLYRSITDARAPVLLNSSDAAGITN